MKIPWLCSLSFCEFLKTATCGVDNFRTHLSVSQFFFNLTQSSASQALCRDSARYEPSWPVMPVISAMRRFVWFILFVWFVSLIAGRLWDVGCLALCATSAKGPSTYSGLARRARKAKNGWSGSSGSAQTRETRYTSEPDQPPFGYSSAPSLTERRKWLSLAAVRARRRDIEVRRGSQPRFCCTTRVGGRLFLLRTAGLISGAPRHLGRNRGYYR